VTDGVGADCLFAIVGARGRRGDSMSILYFSLPRWFLRSTSNREVASLYVVFFFLAVGGRGQAQRPLAFFPSDFPPDLNARADERRMSSFRHLQRSTS